MKPKSLYLIVCVVGTVLPYSQFVPFLGDHGLDLRLFCEQMFSNRIAGFFALDVLVSSVALFALVVIEGRRAGMRYLWAPIAANLAVGVSLGLPLFLYMREGATRVNGGPLNPGRTSCRPRHRKRRRRSRRRAARFARANR